MPQPLSSSRKPTAFTVTFFQALLVAALTSLMVLLASSVVATLIIYQKLHDFSAQAGVTPQQFLSEVRQGWSRQPLQTDGFKHFLILGVDTLNTRTQAPPSTDTMILVSVNLKTGAVNLLSLPRDIWLPDQQTRINGVYRRALEQQHPQPALATQQAVKHLTGIPLHHTLLISLEELSTAVDILGGVEITVPESFSDPTFPRSDVDVSLERDPAKLYKTVTFEQGKQVLSGERVLEYVRSRKSEGAQGGDEARALRQQQVVQALVAKTLQPATLGDPAKLGRLYRLYQDNFSQALPLSELVATGKTLTPHRHHLKLKSHQLTIYPDDPNGILYNPPLWKYNGAWVYEIRNQAQFQTQVRQALTGTQL